MEPVGEEARVLFPRRKTFMITEYGDKHGVMQHRCKLDCIIERGAHDKPENLLGTVGKRRI
jgi:hypothetical protein